MHDRTAQIGAAIRFNRSSWVQPGDVGGRALIFLAALLLLAGRVAAQNSAPPDLETPGVSAGALPMSQSGSGAANLDFFNQDLSTMLRLTYHTESYGQDGNTTGNFDIGTMQMVTMDDTAAFFDGQVTMNESDGVGFNVGLGVRWLDFPPYSFDAGRMEGVSIWADGTHTDAGNFFPQVGVSLESLGETWDFRANGYIPVGDKEQIGPFKSTNQVGFNGNSLSNLTQATVDRSFFSGELEIARRLGAQRDAWGFAGPYFVANDFESSAGFRAGVRGYAYPDLMLQFAVSHDDVFDTNATFAIVWMVGRTRTDFRPACGTADRFREQVQRNDYVVLSHTKRQGGVALTQPDGSALRIIHVDSHAGPGGDGTFEHPFDMLTDVNGTGSQTGDIIFAHSTSVFTGEQTVVLKNSQKLFGEGNNLKFTVATKEKGTVTIPESSPGARALAAPIIKDPVGDPAIQMADKNEVAGFTIDGGTNAIASAPNGAGDPNIHDVTIKNNTGKGIALTPLVRDDDGDPTTPAKTLAFNVNLDKLTFNNVGGDEITIDATPPAGTMIGDPNLTDSESYTINHTTSTGGHARGIVMTNTHTSSSTTASTIQNYTRDGGTTATGAMEFDKFGGSLTVSTTTLTEGTGAGVRIDNGSTGTLTFASTTNFDHVHGPSVSIDGNSTGGQFTFQSNITATPDVNVNAIEITNNSGPTINFNTGVLTLTASGTGNAVELANNTGSTINFNQSGANAKLVLSTTGTGAAFTATGGGTLSVPGANNSATTTNGQDVVITGMTIAGTGVTFSDVNRSGAVASNAVKIENNTGGGIVIGTPGDTAGQSGTVNGGAGFDPIRIANSANTTVSGLIIQNAAGTSGVAVDKSTNDAMTVNINDLEIRDGATGVNVTGNGTTGNLTMTINDTKVLRSTTFGLNFDNVDTGTVQVNNVTLDGANASAGGTGVHILNSNATFTFDNVPASDNTLIQGWGQNDFEVDGGAPTITFNGSIVNASATNPLDTTGRSVLVHNVTGGSMSFTPNSSITDDNAGMSVESNSGGTFTFLGTHNFDTSTADAVTVQNNTGTASVIFDGLDITTTSGRGVFINNNASATSVSINDVDITTTSGAAFTATGGGGLTVTGDNNVISTGTGTGLTISGMNIISQATFESVSVNGAANGIVLTNLTGGQVTVGETAGAQNSGGTLTTTGDAVVVTNTQNVDLLHLQIVNAGGNGATITQNNTATTAMDVTINDLNLDAATGNGIQVTADSTNTFALKLTNSDLESNVVMNATGAGHFGLLVDSNDITTSGNTVAFTLNFANAATSGDVTIRNGNNFIAGDAQALLIDVASAPTVRTLVEDSTFTNSSAQFAAELHGRNSSTSQTTIQGNIFTNNGAGEDFGYSSFDSANVRLNLGGTGADMNTAGGSGNYFLTENNLSDFDVFEKTNTFNNTRNNGTVVPNPAAANFDDLPTAPPLPTVPP